MAARAVSRCPGDGGEPFLGGEELGEDACLDRGCQRRVGAGDEVGQGGDERGVLAGELDGFGAAGVDDPDSVVGEVAGFDEPGPGARGQALDDVLPVLPVAVGAGRVLGVGDVQDQAGDP